MTVDGVTERLQRARLEGFRHQRNLHHARLRKADPADPDSSSNQALSPSRASQRGSTAASNAASNPGLAFLSHTSLSQHEREQRQSDQRLRRRLAGPIPPQSWREGEEVTSNRTANAREAAGLPSQRQICGPLRFFLGEETAARSLPSLRDLTLCAIAALDSTEARPSTIPTCKDVERYDRRLEEYRRTVFRQTIGYVPVHLKRRMVALCGREGRLSRKSVGTLHSILRRTDAEEQAGDGVDVSLEEDTDGDQEDAWDAVRPSDSSGSRLLDQGSCLWKDCLVDLSFYAIGASQLRSLLASDLAVPNTFVNLRALSLAGYKLAMSDPDALFRVLGRLVNLELFSLAGSTTDVATEADTSMFLKRLSRSTERLQVLDLSFCSWLDSSSVDLVPWTASARSAWPRLDHLVLKDCPVFQHPAIAACKRKGMEPPPHLSVYHDSTDPRGSKAANFVASWHALHYGVVQHDGGSEVGSSRSMPRQTWPSTTVRDRPGILPNATPTTPGVGAGSVRNGPNNVGSLTFTRPAEVQGHVRGLDGGQPCTIRYTDTRIRCPTSGQEVEMWSWQRAVVLDAVRGRKGGKAGSGALRRWIEVWF